MSRLTALTIGLLVAASIGGCPAQEQQYDPEGHAIPISKPRYEVTVTVDGEGTVEPGTGVWASGSTATFQATPAAGWRFDRWEGTTTSAKFSQVQFPVERDTTLIAFFVRTYGLTVTTKGNGTVDHKGGTLDVGTAVALKATPEVGWRFDHWEGDISGQSAAVDFKVERDMAVAAVFVKTYSLAIATQGSGTVDHESGVFDAGTVVTLKATPSAGCLLISWGDDVAGADPEVTFVMDKDVSVKATFVRVAGYRYWHLDTGQGSITIAMAGTNIRGVEKSWEPVGPFYLGYEIQGTVAGRQLTLHRITDADPQLNPAATITVTINLQGTWSGLIDGAAWDGNNPIQYADVPIAAEPATCTGFDHPAAGYRAIQFDNLPGIMILTIDGSTIKGNAVIGPFSAADVTGYLNGNTVTLSFAFSRRIYPAQVEATLQADGTLTGKINGSGYKDAPFSGSLVEFP